MAQPSNVGAGLVHTLFRAWIEVVLTTETTKSSLGDSNTVARYRVLKDVALALRRLQRV